MSKFLRLRTFSIVKELFFIIDEKLLELQEAIQNLHLLQGMDNTEKLIEIQKKKIYRIQEDLRNMNEKINLDPVDVLLPLKCRTCPDMKTEIERFECYDENNENCQRNHEIWTPLNYSIMKIIFQFIAILLILGLFLLLTSVSLKYTTNLFVTFFISFSITLIITLVFKKPFTKILNRMAQ